MEEVLKNLDEPINHLVALGLVLVFYALCYSVRLAAGKRHTKKRKIPWSWQRFWNYFYFRIMMGYSLVATVIAVDMAKWLLVLFEITLPPQAMMMLNASFIIDIPFVAGLSELFRGIKLLIKVWKLKENLEDLDMNGQCIIGKWLGQNQGAKDGNAGNAFNLMALPMQGFAGHFRPNAYAKLPTPTTTTESGQKPDNSTSDNPPVSGQDGGIKTGDYVEVINRVDVNGTKLMDLQKTYLVFQNSPSTRTAVLKTDDGDIYARMSYDNIKAVAEV